MRIDFSDELIGVNNYVTLRPVGNGVGVFVNGRELKDVLAYKCHTGENEVPHITLVVAIKELNVCAAVPHECNFEEYGLAGSLSQERNKADRLEDALLAFVERVASKKATCEAEVQVLPQAARVLVEIAESPRYRDVENEDLRSPLEDVKEALISAIRKATDDRPAK